MESKGPTDLRGRAAVQSGSFAVLACVGSVVLALQFGAPYLVGAATLAALFAAIDVGHRSRVTSGSYRVVDPAASTTRFLLRDVLVPLLLLTGGTAIGSAALAEVGDKTNAGLSLPGVLVALTSAGAASYAVVAWLGRRDVADI